MFNFVKFSRMGYPLIVPFYKCLFLISFCISLEEWIFVSKDGGDVIAFLAAWTERSFSFMLECPGNGDLSRVWFRGYNVKARKLYFECVR